MAIEPRASQGVNFEEVAAAGGALGARRSLVDDVYERLVEFLMLEDLAPDTRINIDSLARAWQVSQTPIREAMVRAEEAGLVVREPLRGFRIAPLLTSEEFGQLMQMRLLIEPHCAALACERVSPSLVDSLVRQVEVMRDSPKGPSTREYQAYMRADRAFHDAIAVAAGNRFLRVALSGTSMHAHRFRRFGGGYVDDSAQTLREHSAVVTALSDGDPDAARTAMYDHLVGVARRAHAEAELPPPPSRQPWRAAASVSRSG